MEQIVNAAITELKEELDENIDATTEPSRFVRLMHLKYKCCVIFFLAVIAVMLIIYITIKEVLKDEETGIIVKMMLENYFPNASMIVNRDKSK